jgi:hypothetical protein
MDIVEFNKDSNILTEKYAPTNLKEIIGTKKQIYALVEWLKKYNQNAKINIQKHNNKKSGKKTRKRKIKVKTDEKEELGGDEDDDETVGDGDEDETAETEDTVNAMKKAKKKDPNQCSCAIITGDHGTGKTAVARAVLNSMDYMIKSVNFAKIGSVKNVDDFIENLLVGDDIYDSMEYHAPRKYAIIVDEIQSVSTPTEKNIINGLLKLNSELWACPVVFIGSNKHKKIMSVVKKECYHISMYAPEPDEMMRLLEKVGVGEGMMLEDENVAVEIVKHCQNDYRRLIVTLGELHRLYGSNIIKNTDLKKYMRYTEEKDMDRSIYENTQRLFSQYKGINSALKIFENDKTNMPLMVHQNHFLATTGYILNKSNLINLSAEITENMANGDVVDNYIYSDQNWSLQETHGFYTCVYPSYQMSRNIDVAKLSNDSKYPYYRPTFSPQYPKDLNRTSTRCINYKNVKFANAYFHDMSIDDYVMAVKLIKNLLDDGRIEECEKILKEYNLTAQGIMYVLKIDKINGTRKDVSKSIEKKVKDIAVEPVKFSVIKNNKK